MTASVNVEPQLAREARLRPRFAVAAVVAAVALVVAAVLQIKSAPKIDEATIALIDASRHTAADLAAGAVAAVGSLSIAAVLVFLIDASGARNPQVNRLIRLSAIVGAALAAISSLAYAVVIAQKAHQFVTTGSQTYTQAHALESGGGLVALQLAGLLGALLVAMSLALVSLQAMRVGLLTRFLGYLGMISAALVIFQITPVPVVEIYWFLALAVLLLGRWPSGEPLAWRTGRAERWPSAQEMREQRVRAAGGARAKPARGVFGGKGSGKAATKAAKPSPPARVSSARGATATRQAAKRKRKRRS